MVQEGAAAFRDWVQSAALMIGVVGGAFAVVRGLYEMGQSTRQRKAELRWKQANAAKDLITDIHRDPRASNAVMMMDWSEGSHEYEVAPGVKQMLSYDKILSALGKAEAECTEGWERYIRDCFDWFFYYVDRIEHYIDTGLIEFADVGPVFKPYAVKVRRDQTVFDQFVALRGYELAPRFWKRYETATHSD